MAISLNINGQSYLYPEVGDVAWGPDATDWAVAVTGGMLQKAGGLFQLLAETDFGSAYGVKSIYYKSRTTNPAAAGQIRLARADTVSWRNEANDDDLALSVDASDNLLFNGLPIGNVASVTDTNSIDLTLTGTALSADLKLSAVVASPNNTLVNLNIETDGLRAQIADSAIRAAISVTDTSTIDLTYASGVLSAAIIAGSITNTMINAAAAIAYSKLNLTGSIVNADVNASAAIAYSKLNLTGSIVNADVSASAGIVYSKLTLTSSIVDGDLTTGTINFNKLSTTTCTIDEDNMASDSAVRVPTQQSVKAYVDTSIAAISATGTLYSGKSASYIMLTNDNIRTVGMTTSTTDRTVTLPAAASSTNRIITVKKIDSASGITIVTDGSSTWKLPGQNDAVTVQSTGSAWTLINDDRSQFEYIVGNTYNGVTITLSSSPTVVVTNRSVLVPYRTSDGSYRLRGTASYTVASGSRTVSTVAFSGTVIKNTAGFIQAISGYTNAAVAVTIAFADPTNNNFSIQHGSGSTSAYYLSFDIELNANPSWSYLD